MDLSRKRWTTEWTPWWFSSRTDVSTAETKVFYLNGLYSSFNRPVLLFIYSYENAPCLSLKISLLHCRSSQRSLWQLRWPRRWLRSPLLPELKNWNPPRSKSQERNCRKYFQISSKLSKVILINFLGISGKGSQLVFASDVIIAQNIGMIPLSTFLQ